MVGQSNAMQGIRRLIEQVAGTDASVLILGESGTGKEVAARNLHYLSNRSDKPFVPINCGAIPGELLESELFGHEKGAFTGALTSRQGRFELAQGGTIFLDEIGDMPLPMQVKLLRVLQERTFERVGSNQSIECDVRIIAATHQNLEALVANGSFREDLFHRLNVIRVHVPSLAERRTDIPVLAQHFLEKAARELGDETKRFAPETEDYLKLLPWPGNVRQLENTCRWLHVMASSRRILISDLPPELQDESPNGADSDWETSLHLWATQLLDNNPESPLLDEASPRFERVMITAALQKTSGRKKDAAQLLGWGRNTLTRKMQELDMT